MTIGKSVDVHLDFFAHHTLDRIASSVHLRTDRLDDDARGRLQFLARFQFFARIIQA